MIRKIVLEKVSSYKKPTSLETDKKVNLIYGLNGTGKSTFSNFLYKPKESIFDNCFTEGLTNDEDVIVYNQRFIHDNFFEAEQLRGIFTLSKANKEVQTKIINAENEIRKIDEAKTNKVQELEKEAKAISEKLEKAKNAVWRIKTDYSGGDRVLEFCLDGYKGSKDALFNFIVNLPKSTKKPIKSIEDLKRDLQAISGNNAQKYAKISQITFVPQTRETEVLLSKQIVGNENSTVSMLIKELGNSDWVKAGIQYLPRERKDKNTTCPFCQERTITNNLIDSIKGYFDASYEADISSLRSFLEEYSQAILLLPNKSVFELNPQFELYKKDFEIKYSAFRRVVEDNAKLIEDKIRTPSTPVKLVDSTRALNDLNDVIIRINSLVSEHNKNIDEKETVKTNIKRLFWEIMRWDYDPTISSVISDQEDSKKRVDLINRSIQGLSKEINSQKQIIAEQQKQTVNIEEAVRNINSNLLDLGIDEFRIKNHSGSFYRIVRGEKDNRIFQSLSEGEKMIISFLYFLELCRGKKDVAEAARKKIIVIDDPISSLSHIYVFNVGRLIKNEFFGKKETKDGVTTWSYKYEQVFILTHSLYFFYEITETKHEERKDTQALFRLIKNDEGSRFIPMSYEEIQNDYQAYWFIIKDDKQPAALIANCMRNVIEYFFNFVEKKDLAAFFGQKVMQENRYQAFYRYMNRESHSLGQNIFDFKEFNYADFKDAFAMLFRITGYEDHYKKMIK